MNYHGAEHGEQAVADISSYKEAILLRELSALDECTNLLGAPPILSKFVTVKSGN